MLKFTIIPVGTKAVIKGEIPQYLEDHLVSKFTWVSSTNLEFERQFYANGVCYIGIIRELKEEIEKQGYQCQINWPDLPEKEFDWKFTGEYRPHQKEAVEAIYTERFGFLAAPMRMGKTPTSAAFVAKVGLKTTVIVPNQAPLRQFVKAFAEFTNIQNIGMVGEGSCTIGDVTVCTIQSIVSRYSEDEDLRKHLLESKVIIIDEAHKAAADSFIHVLSFALGDPLFLIGVSATPYRNDDRTDYLKALIGPSIFERSIGELIESGNICPITFYVANVPEKAFGYIDENGPIAENKYQVERQYQKVYKDYIVFNKARHKIIKTFVDSALSNNLTCGIVVDRVTHAEELHKIIPNAVVIHAKTKNRFELLDKLHHREVKCVITTLFQEATDVPSLDCIVVASGGKAVGRFKQRLRNITRFDGDLRTGYYSKKRAFVLYLKDHADFLRSHSTSMVRLIRQIVKEHKDNKLEIC